jgi:hypothetical protein
VRGYEAIVRLLEEARFAEAEAIRIIPEVVEDTVSNG